MHAPFCYVWVSFERNTYTMPHVINISFLIAVPKFISVIEMQELVIMKDLSYSNVRNILQESRGAEGVPERSVRRFLLLIISEINQISV